MMAHLVPAIEKGKNFLDPSDFESFFNQAEIQRLRNENGVREKSSTGIPEDSCKTNLFFGFFMDGTRNNYLKSLEKKNHTETNIVRLYSAFPGQSVPGLLPADTDWNYKKDEFKNYFRVYTPGVGTEFGQVRDSGKGLDRIRGNASGALGERRIIWTLVQAINNVHRFFTKSDLLDAAETLSLCRALTLDAAELKAMGGSSPSPMAEQSPRSAPSVRFKEVLTRLQRALKVHRVQPGASKPERTDPGLVQEIFVSVFGFSRGAAEARVFSHWLVELCKMDARLLDKPGMTLAGFPVTFDFLGVFETVASVGLANTMGIFTGHGGWADSEFSLRVPEEVVQCKHFVSAHEVRRSFPLDSVALNQTYSDNCEEVVYPGVHSDLGGGYVPKEQGKGLDEMGVDMLSRIPLANMYRAARLAGVPLKLELASATVKEYFKIAPETITAFNQYLSAATVTSGSVTAIMREQRKFFILWRKARRNGALEATPSFQRALQVDRNDLHSANLEFEDEIRDFETWCKKKYSNRDHHHTGPTQPQPPGFHNNRDEEWEEVASYWNDPAVPPQVGEFFDNYVHDSRAWFKLGGTEADDVVAELQQWVVILDLYEEDERAGFPNGVRGAPLSQEQRTWATQYKATGRVPEMVTHGREPMMMAQAGYLRYRKIYAGGDRILISGVQPGSGAVYAQLREGPVSVPSRAAAA